MEQDKENYSETIKAMNQSESFKKSIRDSMLFHRKTNAHLLKKKEPKFYQALNKKRSH